MVRVFITLLALLLVTSACDKKTETTPEETKTETAAQETEETKEEEAGEKEEEAEEAPEGARWVESETYGVKFRAPDDWQIAEEGASISATSPDGTITVLLVGTESDGMLSAALEAIKKEISFDDVKLEKDSQTTVNGMPGYAAEGSAVYVKEGGDQEIQFLMNSVRAGDKGVALMVFAEAEMYEAKKEELQGLMKTLQKR